jgi:hypothetical protein
MAGSGIRGQESGTRIEPRTSLAQGIYLLQKDAGGGSRPAPRGTRKSRRFYCPAWNFTHGVRERRMVFLSESRASMRTQ